MNESTEQMERDPDVKRANAQYPDDPVTAREYALHLGDVARHNNFHEEQYQRALSETETIFEELIAEQFRLASAANSYEEELRAHSRHTIISTAMQLYKQTRRPDAKPCPAHFAKAELDEDSHSWYVKNGIEPMLLEEYLADELQAGYCKADLTVLSNAQSILVITEFAPERACKHPAYRGKTGWRKVLHKVIRRKEHG